MLKTIALATLVAGSGCSLLTDASPSDVTTLDGGTRSDGTPVEDVSPRMDTGMDSGTNLDSGAAFDTGSDSIGVGPDAADSGGGTDTPVVPGVRCGRSTCSSDQECCFLNGVPDCIPAGAECACADSGCRAARVSCESNDDCGEGVCCYFRRDSGSTIECSDDCDDSRLVCQIGVRCEGDRSCETVVETPGYGRCG